MKQLSLFLAAMVIACAGFAQGDISAAFSKSYEYEQVKQYNKAIQVLDDVYTQSSYPLNLRLGWLHYSNKAYAKSATYYKKAIALAPNALEPRFGYVYPASAMENWNEVEQQYLEILKIDKENTTANYRLGYMYYIRKDYAKAKVFLERLVSLYPFDYDGVALLAWTNLKLGNTSESRRLFQRALLISPDDESATEGLKLIQ